MDIIKNIEEKKVEIKLIGRLDTTTAPLLEAELKTSLNDVEELDFNFEELDYISSAGLRVLLAAQKVMNRQGVMKLHNVKPEVMEVLEITGFLNILSVE